MKRTLIIIFLFFSCITACYSQEGYKGFEISVVSEDGNYSFKILKNDKDVSNKYTIANMTVTLFEKNKFSLAATHTGDTIASLYMTEVLNSPKQNIDEYRFEFEAVIISYKNYQKFVKEFDNSLKDPKTIPVLTIVREKYWD